MVMGQFPSFLEEQEPEAAFYRGMRERLGGAPEQSIYGRYMQRQAPAFGTAFRFQNLLNPPETQQENPFLQFARTATLPQLRGQAQSLFGQLASGTGGTAPSVRQQFAQPTEDQASDLTELARLALQNRISPLALSLLNMPSGGQLRSRFIGEQPAGGDFINFVRNQLGLGLL